MRPFTRSAQVACRGCSGPLQRASSILGRTPPAACILQKLTEHSGSALSASKCWPIVSRHAETIGQRPKAAARIPQRDGVAQRIGEIDEGFHLPGLASGRDRRAKLASRGDTE